MRPLRSNSLPAPSLTMTRTFTLKRHLSLFYFAEPLAQKGRTKQVVVLTPVHSVKAEEG